MERGGGEGERRGERGGGVGGKGGGCRIIVNAGVYSQMRTNVTLKLTRRQRGDFVTIRKRKKVLSKAFLTIPVTGSVLRATSGRVLPQVSWN